MTLGNVLSGARCDLAPDDMHMILAGCDDCLARWVAGKSLERVEQWYNSGHVRQALYEAYRHVWATSAARFSSLGDGWTEPPGDPEVAALVALIKERLS